MRKTFIIILSLVMTSLSTMAQYSPQAESPTLPGLEPVLVQYYWNMSGSTASNLTGSTLGTKNAYPLYLITNNITRMTIDTLGNIGIGTDIPHQKLHIVDGNMLISRTSTRAPGSTNGSLLFGNHTTNSAPYGRWGIEYLSEDGANGLNFWKPYMSPTDTTVNYVLFLNDNGNVGIGTYNPQAKLAVNGEILAKSVRVNTGSEYWPDYVFSSDYELMSLDDLENYIEDNKHLPGIISAEEVRHQGDVDLGEMNVKLLEKIEELTLYIINLQKQIDELKNMKE